MSSAVLSTAALIKAEGGFSPPCIDLYAWYNCANTPATPGQDIEVPDLTEYLLTSIVESTSEPTAQISGLIRPSAAGPQLLLGANASWAVTLLTKSERKNIIGFFGDAMQSIYEDGIGNLDEYKGDGVDTVNEIPKKQNRRNPQL
ncbi:hypothetical protein OSTOST_12589, partial [Ostertagia ostertagi]